MKRVDNRSPPIYNKNIGRQKSRLSIPTINKGLKGTIMNPKNTKRGTRKMSINFNMTVKDIFNAKSSSKSVKDYVGVTLTATGCAVVDTTNNETGEVKSVGYIATSEGVFGFTSGVLMNTMEELSEYMESAGEPVEIQFHENTSNAGKKFYTLEIM